MDRDEVSDPNNPFGMGNRRSFVPVLGEPLWQPASSENFPFFAYISRLDDGREIGFVRVPEYTYDQQAAEQFEELIARFESRTSAMVLDEVNNPGGSMLQMYAILATLTDRALSVPLHEMNLDQDEIDEASRLLEDVEDGEPVPPYLVAYSRWVLSEVKAGRAHNTKPGYLQGIPEVLPAETHYTKKIVVLINELTFSAGEFLAAILQDNGRATLFGIRTPGAGGCTRFHATDDIGGKEFRIDGINLRWTLAWRSNGEAIEHKGVRPDVKYSPTEEDLRYGFRAYREALLAAIGV